MSGLESNGEVFSKATYNAEVRANVFVETGVELVKESMGFEVA